MKIFLFSLVATLVFCVSAPLQAAPNQNAQQTASGAATTLRYKMISGFKQPFNDDLQLHLSKGWTPVGGVSVTTWNGDLYFAILLSHPAAL